jgi:hypothetical protein
MSSDVSGSFRNSHGGYSQHDEDIQLAKILPSSGYFLEIGAYCPYTFSNTRFLVEKGWKGCYVDGCSYAISRFIDVYKNNDDISIVHALIGDNNKFIEFYNSIADAVSTTDINFMNAWKSGGHPFKKIYTSMITFEVLKSTLPSKVDFINIDVEGQSAYLSTLIDYDSLNTNFVCIEHDNKIQELINIFKVKNFNYHWHNHTNIIFKR